MQSPPRQFIQRRKFPRFRVTDLRRLTSKFGESSSEKTLVSFSLGGCGFYADTPDPIFQPPKQIVLKFELEPINSNNKNQTYEIHGNLIYLQKMEIDGHEAFYYGVEFLESQRDLIRPIVEELQGLADDGSLEAS